MNAALYRKRALQRDIYGDIGEVLWKYPLANAYRLFFRQLRKRVAAEDPTIRSTVRQLTAAFNGNHEYSVFSAKASVLHATLKARLIALRCGRLAIQLDAELQKARTSIGLLLGAASKIAYYPEPHQQSLIRDGNIRIAGLSLEAFASQRDYVDATLSLLSPRYSSLNSCARKAFRRGFTLTAEEQALVRVSAADGFEFTDVVTALLLHEQATHRFQSVQEYEFDPELPFTKNAERMCSAVDDAYFLLGKVFAATVSLVATSHGRKSGARNSHPIRALLASVGLSNNERRVRALQKVALAHSTHGLNSGELVARLAGSVRTTFPRALIASLNVRSGVLHSGAIKRCMLDLQDYLLSGMSAADYVSSVGGKSRKFFGFGHRVHKTNERDPVAMLGKDPRVRLYVEATKEGFPEQAILVERVLNYAKEIRRLRPSLGANTDFGAAVLFSALQLSPGSAESFFSAFRCAGLCATVLNELMVKGNSRRPPFPEVVSFA